LYDRPLAHRSVVAIIDRPGWVGQRGVPPQIPVSVFVCGVAALVVPPEDLLLQHTVSNKNWAQTQIKVFIFYQVHTS
jgi:hypothetical protein